MTAGPLLLGCDFSSAPSHRKQIALAWCELSGHDVRLKDMERFSDLDTWQRRLATTRWVGGFDLPFGLPRELVVHQGWPLEWEACTQHFVSLERAELRIRFKAFCDARPAGRKFAHRATDGPAGSSPSMKWVNPPVAWMLHAGLPRLIATGAHFPAHRVALESPEWGDRVALEAYPGLLARELLGGHHSYKSDDATRQTPAREAARAELLAALTQGHTRLGVRLHVTDDQASVLVADASGDSIDAVLCAVQAAWAWRARLQGNRRWGLPESVDPLEGWILTA